MSDEAGRALKDAKESYENALKIALAHDRHAKVAAILIGILGGMATIISVGVKDKQEEVSHIEMAAEFEDLRRVFSQMPHTVREPQNNKDQDLNIQGDQETRDLLGTFQAVQGLVASLGDLSKATSEFNSITERLKKDIARRATVRNMELSSVSLQIGIVISSASIAVRVRWLTYAAAGLGFAASAYALFSYLQSP